MPQGTGGTDGMGGAGESVMTVAASGGRQLEVLAAGPEDGLPLVFHNGTPAGLVTFAPMIAAAAERGLRTVMYARPGYGGSTPQPGRRVADAAGDVAAVLDALGAEQFVSAGMVRWRSARTGLRRAAAGPVPGGGVDRRRRAVRRGRAGLAGRDGGGERRGVRRRGGGRGRADRVPDRGGGGAAGHHRRADAPPAWATWPPRPTRRCSPASSPTTWRPTFRAAVRAGHRGLARRRPGLHRGLGLRAGRGRAGGGAGRAART